VSLYPLSTRYCRAFC